MRPRIRVGFLRVKVPDVAPFFTTAQVQRFRSQSASERRLSVGWWANVASLVVGVLVGVPVALVVVLVLWLLGMRAASVAGLIGAAYVFNGIVAYRQAMRGALFAGLAERGLALALLVSIGGAS